MRGRLLEPAPEPSRQDNFGRFCPRSGIFLALKVTLRRQKAPLQLVPFDGSTHLRRIAGGRLPFAMSCAPVDFGV